MIFGGTVVESGATPRDTALKGRPRAWANWLKYEAAMRLFTLPCSHTNKIRDSAFSALCAVADLPTRNPRARSVAAIALMELRIAGSPTRARMVLVFRIADRLWRGPNCRTFRPM